jgi:hypothetical protein
VDEMKLSTAMMLGAATCKMIPADWNSCAFGAAGNAVGVPRVVSDYEGDTSERFPFLAKVWPWIRVDDDEAFPMQATVTASTIWQQFDNLVCTGEMTFEQLVDYVRSIEPECGRCNSFQCTCAKVEEPADFGIVCDPQEVCDDLGINYDPHQWKP